jgi:pSer/pThr/pTyr-binding forkhead associated (FHA) protein
MDVGLVCDSCSTFNPMGSRGCSRCGAELSLDKPNGARPSTDTGIDSGPVAAPTIHRECPRCHDQVTGNQRFCGSCGQPMPDSVEARDGDEPPPQPPRPPSAVPAVGSSSQPKKKGVGKKTLFFGAMQASRAKLVLIKGDGLDGVSFTLAGDDHIAGREDAALLFDEDPFLSPRHANFFYRSGDLVVRDESSINGVFIGIRGTCSIGSGDRFLVGEQVIEVQCFEGGREPAPELDGTYYYASPRNADWRLIQILRGGETGLAYSPDGDVVSLGREDNDLNFPDDPFISGHHAQVSFAAGEVNLTDLGSKNGTFLRVNDESRLEHGDYVFMGQQLLRVEIV